jgi:hypothetical protein
MNFMIYEKDGDRPGQITQSNKVYEHENYHNTLHEHGYKDFVALDHSSFLSPDHNYIQKVWQ